MNWKKITTGFAAMVLGTALTFGTAVEAASAPAMRYFMQQPGVQGSATPYGNNKKAGHYVQAGDAKIYYEVYGKGKPLFVFHGGGVGTPYEMGQLIDKLQQDYQVIAVSTRGHGRSEIGHSPLTYEQKAEDMLAVMNAVTNESAILLGFSDGAYTAYKVASMYPERYQEFCDNYMAFWSKMEVGEDFLETIQCPVLLIAGDEDDHAPMVTMVEAEQYIPNASLCIVPKAWHSAFNDNFPVTWAAMQGFMQTDRSKLTGSKKVDYNNRR